MAIWTAYQGVEVLESDSKVKCRHPKFGYDPKRLATLAGASLLALADGTFLVVCDECGFNGLTGREPYVKPEGDYLPIIKQADSLLAHINGMHHPNKEGRVSTRYTNEQIKVAIKVWLKWRATGILNWTTSACEELESLGFKPYASSAWNAGQLGSLVRRYIKRPEFKNLKAGPMDEEDKAALEAMLREAQAREGRGGTHLADNVRITSKGNKSQTRSEHRPVNFDEIIAASDAKEARQEEEPTLPDTPTPVLSFSPSGGADQTPVKALQVDATPLTVPAQRFAPAAVATVVEVESDFKLVSDLGNGMIVFTYKGTLMGGKSVKGVEI